MNYNYNYIKEKSSLRKRVIACATARSSIKDILPMLNLLAKKSKDAGLGDSIVARDDFELIRQVVQYRFGINIYLKDFQPTVRFLYYFESYYDAELVLGFLDEMGVIYGMPDKKFVKCEDYLKVMSLSDSCRKKALQQTKKYWMIYLRPRFL